MAAGQQPALQPPVPPAQQAQQQQEPPTPASPQQQAPQNASAAKPFWGPPTAKVSVGVLAGALSALILPILKTHNFGVDFSTPQAGAAITSVLTFVIQYLVPERT